MGLLVRSSPKHPIAAPSLLRIVGGVALALGVGVALTWAVSRSAPEREKTLVLLAPASGKLVARLAADEARTEVVRSFAQPASLVMPMSVEWPMAGQWSEPERTVAEASPAVTSPQQPRVKPVVTVARAAPLPVPRPSLAVQQAVFEAPFEITPPAQRQGVTEAEPGLLTRAATLVSAPIGGAVSVASGAADTVVAAGRWTAGAASSLLPRW